MRILVADDHVLFRESLRLLLTRHGMSVVGEASNGREAVELTRRLRPEVVLMDLTMPELSGIEAIHQIRTDMPEIKVVVLTGSTEDEDLFEAIRCGASGYLMKDLESKRFLSLLEGVTRGEPALTPLLAKKLLDEFANPQQASPKGQDPDALTSREMEVLEWMVEGVTSNRALAKQLGVSENTIKFHVRNILDKLHLHNRAQVVAYALRNRIVDTDTEGG